MTLEKLDHYTVLKISGSDAQSFLQGQLSNDTSRLAAGWHLSGYCNPKGRLIALLTLWQIENTIYALIDKTLVETTLKRLRMYVMRSDVAIEEQTGMQCFGCFSDKDYDGLTGMLAGNVRKLSDEIVALGYGTRFLLLDPKEKLNAVSARQWNLIDVQEGLPRVTAQSSELFVPQMLNLDLLDAVSFKKGCYTGQEIVARMHYLGKLKQRMYLCEVSAQKPPEVGEKVLLNDKNAGTVVRAAETIAPVDSDNKPSSYLALAVLRTEMIVDRSTEMAVFSLEQSGSRLTVLPEQPYSLESTNRG